MICANLLAGKMDYQWDLDILDIDPSGTVPWKAPDEHGLVYRFLLMKAREAAFIGKSFREQVPEGSETDVTLRKAGR